MRGIDWFPAREHRDWARAYDQNLATWMVAQERGGRNFGQRLITQPEFRAIYTALEPEFQRWLRQRAAEEANEEAAKDKMWSGIPDLDIKSLQEKEYDRPKLAPFKLEYDSLEEVTMRFRQTVIQIRDNPFYVSDLRKMKNRFWMLLENVKEEKAKICLDDITDLRGVPPGYVQLRPNTPGYLARVPARVNQQGMTSGNVCVRAISSDGNMPFNNKELLLAIDSKGRTCRWVPQYQDLLVSRVIGDFRLSDEVAMYTKKGQDTIFVAYKGRPFGKLIDNHVEVLDEDDLDQAWINRHFQKINLEVVR